MRTWDKRPETIDQLVSAFFANDPYYPRPRASDSLYSDFKAGYLGGRGRESEALAAAFFDAIELTQAQRVVEELKFPSPSRFVTYNIHETPIRCRESGGGSLLNRLISRVSCTQ